MAVGIVSAIAWAGSAPAWAQPARAQRPEPVPLADGQTLARSHGATEETVYAFDAVAGRSYLLLVEQRGFDLIVTVQSPGGEPASFNSPLLRDEREAVLIENAAPGRHLVAVRTDEHTGAAGGHSITLTELRGGDREREAWRLMTRGAAENFAGGEEAWGRSVAAYEAAARLWEAAGRTRERAHALYAAGAVEFWQRYDWVRSADLARRAAALYETLGEAGLAANAVLLEAMAFAERAIEAGQAEAADGGDSATLFEQTLALLERAADVHERLGNVYDLGLAENMLGYTEQSRGELAAARGHFERAAALLQSREEWTAELNPRSNLAVLDGEAGNVAAALETFSRIIEILPPGKAERYRADTLYNLGAAHRLLGNVDEALQAFTTALEIQNRIDDLQGRGRSLRGIGETYYAAGDLELATQYLEQALPIARATGDGRQQEGILRILGNIAFLDGEHETALARHREAMAAAASPIDRAYLELLLAKDLLALGRHEEALDAASGAYDAAASTGSDLLLADALHELGRARLAQGEQTSAAAHLERASALYDRLGLPERQADVRHTLSLAARAAGRLDLAIEHGAGALAELEALRLRVAQPELRAFYAARRRGYYDTQIGLLMQRHAAAPRPDGADLRAALETSERSRARVVADLLQEAAVDVRYGVDPALERRRAELYDRLAEESYKRNRLLEETPDPDEARERLAPITAALAAIENELNLLDIELRRTSPRFASLSSASVLSSDEMQAALDADTVLLQYALGDEASYVWAVTRDTVDAVRLADRATIESAVRRALAALHSPGLPPAEVAGPLRELAAQVLQPVAAHLGKARVAVALDGALQYVPFGVLPVTLPGGEEGPLLRTHEVVDVLSMSTLAVQRARPREAPRRLLAIFADPVFEPSDPRFAGRIDGEQRSEVASVVRSGAAALHRLPSSGFEAESIAALVGGDRLLLARGFAANRDAMLRADLGSFRFLHFATHGLIDSRYPGLSALALSQLDERGMPREGLVRLHDIYNLDLNADLVVLSACDTALGREIRGEGLLGLTQGFMYAGARSIVASLWQVPDRATAELMTRFYRYMLSDGLRPAAALQRAQLSIAAERRWSNPYFWGGFVLLGDWL